MGDADQLGTTRGVAHWGGITVPRYFADRKEKLIVIVFVQGPSIWTAYHAD